MGLGRGLVDRARVLVTVADGPKVEGRRQTREEASEWFRARFDEQGAAERDPETGVVVHRPELMYGRRDVRGGEIPPIRASDRIEVDSRPFGRRVFEVTGDPDPMRKRRTVLGWTASLARVQENALREPRS